MSADTVEYANHFDADVTCTLLVSDHENQDEDEQKSQGW
jgi:hypothetical protein